MNTDLRHITIVPWRDPAVDLVGHPVRSDYVEWFWLPVLGPSATWLLRRCDLWMEHNPAGFTMDSHDIARSLGIASRDDVGSTFARSLTRLQMFGAAQPTANALAVRRVMPRVAAHHLARMPAYLRAYHAEWLAAVA
jgi:hypothetical protein